MFVVKNVGAFEGQVKAWLASVADAAGDATVGLGKVAFKQILDTSPQSSGDFVAGTRVSIGSASPLEDYPMSGGEGAYLGQYGITRFKAPRYGRGDEPAKAFARARVVWPKITLGQRLVISSTANHDEYYSWKIEDGSIKFRPVNAGASRIYAKASNYAATNFGNISRPKLEALRNYGT